MRLRNKTFIGLILLSSTWVSVGFLLQRQQKPQLSQRHPSTTDFIIHQRQQPKFRSDMISVLNRQRRSVSNVQTMGLFGLGAPEVGIIVVVAAFIIGPQKIGSMLGKFTGEAKSEFDGLPSELKKIPKEFQKGFDESSENAKARNAKQMEAVPDEEVIKK